MGRTSGSSAPTTGEVSESPKIRGADMAIGFMAGSPRIDGQRLSCSAQHFDREFLRRDANALRTCGEDLLDAPAQCLRVQSSDLVFERGGHHDRKLSGAIRDAG